MKRKAPHISPNEEKRSSRGTKGIKYTLWLDTIIDPIESRKIFHKFNGQRINAGMVERKGGNEYEYGTDLYSPPLPYWNSISQYYEPYSMGGMDTGKQVIVECRECLKDETSLVLFKRAAQKIGKALYNNLVPETTSIGFEYELKSHELTRKEQDESKKWYHVHLLPQDFNRPWVTVADGGEGGRGRAGESKNLTIFKLPINPNVFRNKKQFLDWYENLKLSKNEIKTIVKWDFAKGSELEFVSDPIYLNTDWENEIEIYVNTIETYLENIAKSIIKRSDPFSKTIKPVKNISSTGTPQISVGLSIKEIPKLFETLQIKIYGFAGVYNILTEQLEKYTSKIKGKYSIDGFMEGTEAYGLAMLTLHYYETFANFETVTNALTSASGDPNTGLKGLPMLMVRNRFSDIYEKLLDPTQKEIFKKFREKVPLVEDAFNANLRMIMPLDQNPRDVQLKRVADEKPKYGTIAFSDNSFNWN
jgi:hypothetical protein